MKKLAVSKQTIYREIHRNSIYKNPDIPNRVKRVNDPRSCIHLTPGSRCTRVCNYFIKQQCKQVTKFPFICNRCPKRGGCSFSRRYYYTNKAQEKIDLIFSHINSVYKTSLNGVRPIDLAYNILGEDFLKIINTKKLAYTYIYNIV